MAPKQPSNADIYRKLDNMDVRISNLESWKIAEDAAKKAVSEFKTSEANKGKRRLVTDIGTFLGVLTLLLWVVIQYFATRGK